MIEQELMDELTKIENLDTLKFFVKTNPRLSLTKRENFENGILEIIGENEEIKERIAYLLMEAHSEPRRVDKGVVCYDSQGRYVMSFSLGKRERGSYLLFL